MPAPSGTHAGLLFGKFPSDQQERRIVLELRKRKRQKELAVEIHFELRIGR